MAEGGPQSVPITALSIQQLAEVRQDLEKEVDSFVQNALALQQAAGRYAAAGQAVEKLQQQKQGQQLLVPLTESLYVSGELESIEAVTLEIGTGYYVEQNVDKAVDYCKRKINLVKNKSDEIGGILKQKQMMLDSVTQVLDQKLKMEEQQHQQKQVSQS